MTKYQIKTVHGTVLYEGVASDLRELLERAVKDGANLQYADLRKTNLRHANLQYADLQHASLQYADLRNTNLRYANLQGANLQGVNIQYANLQYADLQGLNLQYADLQGVNLQYASLQYTNLRNTNLQYADLQGVNLRNTNLQSADLQGVNLRNTNLRYANLQGANLQYADLQHASLQYADLRNVKGFQPERCQDLLLLLDQPGPIRLYKLVNSSDEGPYNGGIKYESGKEVEVSDANTDPEVTCGSGINVATLPWCLREWSEGYRVLIVEFTAKDIACIPHASDGKLRLHRCKVVGEKDVSDLVASSRS